MIRDVYDIFLYVAAALFGVTSLAIGWSTLRDRRSGAGGRARAPTAIALELLAWALPTALMVALFVAAIRSEP